MNFLVKEFCCAVHLNKLRMSASGTQRTSCVAIRSAVSDLRILLTAFCVNQRGAGHGFPVNIFRQRELQNADEDDFGKVLHNLMIQRLLRFPFSQVQLSMRKHAEAPQKSPQRLMHR